MCTRRFPYLNMTAEGNAVCLPRTKWDRGGMNSSGIDLAAEDAISATRNAPNKSQKLGYLRRVDVPSSSRLTDPTGCAALYAVFLASIPAPAKQACGSSQALSWF